MALFVSQMRFPGQSVAALVIVAVLTGCSAEKPLDPQATEKRLAFCRSVIDAVKPGDKTCGPYLEQLKRERDQVQKENELTLRSDSVTDNVSISSQPEIWTDEYIIARVPNGTKAMRMQVARYPLPVADPYGKKEIVRFLVRTAEPGSVTGWVHAMDAGR